MDDNEYIKTYEPILENIKARKDEGSDFYFIYVGNKQIGFIEDETFETLYIEKG